MTHFRLRYEHRGGRVHVRVFSAQHDMQTHGKNGALVFRQEEWESFLRCLSDRGEDRVTVLPEENAP